MARERYSRCRGDRGAFRRQLADQQRGRRRGRLGVPPFLGEPPIEFLTAAVAVRRRSLVLAQRLTRRASEADVEMVVMAPPRPHLAQPVAITAGFAAKLAPFQESKIVVNGYTDNAPIGPELKRQGITSNQELSQKRAETVMQFMVSQGVKPDLVAAQGFGDADPVAPNDTAQGRAQNRRVELTLAAPTS